ncbi:hypothetical protein [Fodinicurvata sp. EGI_FJ10296]|uniref:hypothetical protein n=1 Tax=Fodinicurvata sp. EGI_FJ10296 TaxID=3231908 RepID=UPI00345147D8
MNESDVISAIDDCHFVCRLTTRELGAEAGREKSLTATRLATAAIALIWKTPSRALSRINLAFDRQPHRREFLSHVPEESLSVHSMWSYAPSGPHISPDEWEIELLNWADTFAAVGDIHEFVVIVAVAAE